MQGKLSLVLTAAEEGFSETKNLSFGILLALIFMHKNSSFQTDCLQRVMVSFLPAQRDLLDTHK